MRRLSLAASLLLFLTAPAAAFDAKDRTFQPGRVGAIVAGKTKPADLARLYGAGNVRKEMMDEPGGGEMHPGAFVFKETPDALQVHFSDDGKSIAYVTVLGKNWASKDGLRVGTSAAELERLNGGPFDFYGFGFDYGGQVFAGGAALKDYDIFIHPTREDDAAMEQLTKPEAKVSSSHPAVKTAGLAVSFISVSFRPK